jgi:uncharacterized protein YggE
VVFSVRECGALEQQALAKAMAVARKRAEQVAAQAGVTLREVQAVTLDCTGWPAESATALLPLAPLAVEPTDVKLKVTARVTFRYD